ncbi:hypothetical protein TNCV_2235851 [Trichonephila clavipes]|nr:hypothetical protein TNCV_2235851 [Trichonephila clavipes]
MPPGHDTLTDIHVFSGIYSNGTTVNVANPYAGYTRNPQSGGPRTNSGSRENFAGPQKNAEYTYSSH